LQFIVNYVADNKSAGGVEQSIVSMRGATHSYSYRTDRGSPYCTAVYDGRLYMFDFVWIGAEVDRRTDP